MSKPIAAFAAVAVLGGAAGAAGVVATPLAGADDSGARNPSTHEEHCLLPVIDRTDDGELVTGEMECFGSLADALAQVDAARDLLERAGPELSDALRAELLAQSGIIATHYDGANRTGSTVTVTGDDCAGGYLNLPSNWVDRISSTSNGCPSVRFFDGFNKTGSVEVTGLSTVNLGALNNAANSIQYAS